MVASGNNLGLHNGVQSHGIDGDTGTLGDNDEQGALELEVNKEGNVVDAFFTLGQLRKDEETAPTLAGGSYAHTLPDGGQRLEVALSDASGAHDAHSPDPTV